MSVLDIFAECNKAVMNSVLIQRPSEKDKEFHFQNWFAARLRSLELNYDAPGRNSYPDFKMVSDPIGFELKGLNYPGRISSFDCNSKVCTGSHNGRTIYYAFGRYPKTISDEYPVYDLVVFHGNFLNARSDYIHKNKSFRGFGSYGDILVRDRKMYVAPTPFGLLDGLDRQVTLILKEDEAVDDRFHLVGEIERVETPKIVTKYTFDLTVNELTKDEVDNPTAGTVHRFRAYRLKEAPDVPVSMKSTPIVPTEEDADRLDAEVEEQEEKSKRSRSSEPKKPRGKRTK